MLYLQQRQQQAMLEMQQAQAQMQQPGMGQPAAPPQQGMSPGQGIPPEVMAGGMQGPQPGPGQEIPPEMAGEPGYEQQ